MASSSGVAFNNGIVDANIRNNRNNNNNNNSKSGPIATSGNGNEATTSQRQLSASSRPNSSSRHQLFNNYGNSKTVSDSESATTGSNSYGVTELMVACQADDVERANAIIQRYGSSVVSTRDNYGRTALHYAAEVAALKCSEILLFHNPRLLHDQDVDGCTALHGAVIAGNLASVRWLIQHGASPTAVDNEQHTVLHWATVSAHPEIVEYLLREVKTTPLPDLHHAYPLHYAAQMCGTDNGSSSGNGNGIAAGAVSTTVSGTQGLTSQLALLTLLKLVECGHPLDVCDEDNRQPIIWAANNGAAEACYVLVNAGGLVNAADKDGLTALHCAATRGQARCLSALLRECGARHDAQDSNKCTPLFYAATFGHVACCRVLIENGANVNHIDRKHRTAAHCAASKGFTECLKFLMSLGANIWQRSVKGDYPLSEAIANGHTGLVTQLLASFNSEERIALTKVRRGRTPLHSAAAANQLELCKVLLDIGSPVNALHYASSQYYSPYDFAVIRGNVEVAEYLRARGAAPASKVIKHGARLIQKYFRAWHANKQRRAIEQQKHILQRPKSLTNSERGIKLEPIVPASIVSPDVVEKSPSAQQPLPTPSVTALEPVATAAKKPRPTHKNRTRTVDNSKEMTDYSADIDASAGFFDDDEPKSPASRQSSAKQHPAGSSSNLSSSAKDQQLDASMNSANFNDAVFASTPVEESARAPAPVPAPPPPQIVTTTTTESSLNYDEYPHGGGGVRIEITAASTRTLPSSVVSQSQIGPPDSINVDKNSDVSPSISVETVQKPAAEPQVVPSPKTQTPAQTTKQTRPFSSGQDLDNTDELEKIIQQSTSGGESLSLRDEDDDGVESDDGTDRDLRAAARRRVIDDYHSKDKDSGTNNSSIISQKQPSADDSSPSPAVTHEASQPTTQPYSRAQSSTKSVRIVETPIVLEPSGGEVEYYDDYERQRQRREEEQGDNAQQKRVWVDALGRAHQTPTAMKMARPLQRLRMKSSIVRVKSVSEQVHKNVNQYERQRLLIEELKRLKRLQISKRNGVDPQYLSRSFTAIARKNAMISSTGGIDDAEKLLYDELYRRRLTEYRYIPEYHVEPPNDYAIYQVHNHRSPPITTTTWQMGADHGVDGRAVSAPVFESATIRRHYEAATRRINQEMMQRVEKAYVPQPHIQLLLDREDQMLSARSGTSLALHHQSNGSIGVSPRVGSTAQPGLMASNASLAASPYGDSIRPHTSPGKMQQNQQQQVITTSTTTVLSRGGFIKVRNANNTSTVANSNVNNSSSPRNRENAVPSPHKQQPPRHPQATPITPSTPPPGGAKQQQKQQQSQPQRAGSAHSPHMQPLLASLIETKNVKTVDPSSANRVNNVNLPEV